MQQTELKYVFPGREGPKRPRLMACTAAIVAALAMSGCGGSEDVDRDAKRASGVTPGSESPNVSALALARAPTKVALRDTALMRMRAFDQTAVWGHSRNWSNGAWEPWHRYLVGELSYADYFSTAPDGYRFNDVYGFNSVARVPANFSAMGGDCYFTPNAVNSLAARFYRTRDSRFIASWLNIHRDIALNERQAYFKLSATHRRARRDCSDTDTGNAGALLSASLHLSAMIHAMANIAKALDAPVSPSKWTTTSHEPRSAALTAAQKALLPPEKVFDIISGYMRGIAPDLLKFYEPRRRVPNQRLEGLHALALISEFFSDHPDVKPMIPAIDRAVNAYIDQNHYPDGGMLEQSLNYNLHCEELLEALAGMPRRVWSSNAKAKLQQFRRLKAAISTPQGGLPQIGNSNWTRGDLPGSLSFTRTSMAFPFSGYYVQRSDWSFDAAYLFFYGQRLSSGHVMTGGNSLQLGAYGRKLLIAGGTPNYGDPDRDYAKADAYRLEGSTFKTNTIVVDGKSQLISKEGAPLTPSGSPEPGFLFPTPIDARWHSSPRFDFVEGLHTGGYDGLKPQNVSHWRGVVFVRSLRSWVVVDILRSPAAHAYTQIWKFAMPVWDATTAQQTEGFVPHQISTRDNDRRIVSNDETPGAVNLSIRQFGPSISYRTFFGSDKGPYGYVGIDTGNRPGFSPDVHATFFGAGDQVVVSLLRPFVGSVGDGVVARDASGDGSVGADLRIGDTELFVRASSVATTLKATGLSAASAHLMVIERAAGATHQLVVGDPKIAGASFEVSGASRIPLSSPAAFAWQEETSGKLTPSYTH